jgi:Flp pilus assembly protein TadD
MAESDSFAALWTSRITSAFQRFSPGLPHYLFAGALLARLFSLERFSRSPLFLPSRGDMHFYNDWAQQILRGEFNNHGAFYGLPLYPYVLALFYRIFGYSPFIPGILQAVLDSATAVLIYSLSLHLFRSAGKRLSPSNNGSGADQHDTPAKWFAAVAAVAWIFYVPAQAYSIILMPTVACVFVSWFVVWRIVRLRTTPGWRECLFLGLIIGLAAMAIATTLFLIPLVLAAIWLKANATVTRTVWLRAALFFVAVGIGTSPCWIYNYFIARDPVFLSAHSGVNFWIGNNPQANGYPRFPPGLRSGQAAMLQDSITAAETAAGHPLKRAEVSAYWSHQAWSYIAQNPGRWFALLFTKLRNFWSAFQYDDLSVITNLRAQSAIFPGLYFGIVAAFGLTGILFGWRLATPARWIVAAIILQMLAVLTVFVTERYRLPSVPGLLVLAAFGLSVLWHNLAMARLNAVGVYLGLLLVSVLLVSWPQRNPALWALDAYNSGWQALESGDLAMADEKLSLARRYVPTNSETNFALGNLRLAQGDATAARNFYLVTLKYDAAHRGALNNLGVIALQTNDYGTAEMWLRRAENIEPGNAKTHYLLGHALLGEGNREGAQREAIQATVLDPRQPEFKRLSDELSGDSH